MGKRILLVAIGVFVSALGFAQRPPNNARGPVILVDRPGDDKIQTTNPTGHYFDDAAYGGITHGFDTGEFNMGDWVFNVETDACPDCDPGQYLISGEYKGITYVRENSTLNQEEGFFFGVLNPSTGVVDFRMIATNCLDVNPSNNKYQNPGPFSLGGTYDGGGVGELPGAKMSIKNGVITGRISGRDCYNETIYADVRLVR